MRDRTFRSKRMRERMFLGWRQRQRRLASMKVKYRLGHFAELGVKSQLVSDVQSHVARLALGGVEGHNTRWMRVLAVDQIADQRLALHWRWSRGQEQTISRPSRPVRGGCQEKNSDRSKDQLFEGTSMRDAEKNTWQNHLLFKLHESALRRLFVGPPA